MRNVSEKAMAPVTDIGTSCGHRESMCENRLRAVYDPRGRDAGAAATRSCSRGLASALLVACCAWACAAFALPATAHAWLNDAAGSYPATQEITVSGDALTGADVPEGTYAITAQTSSYMCNLTDVTVTSSGGDLIATFTLSGAYNALYMGTAEEAAAAAGENGADYAPYYVSEPLEGYEARQFTLPIAALNQPFDMATFSGGRNGAEEGVWYTRTVVFCSSAEVEAAVAGASGEETGLDRARRLIAGLPSDPDAVDESWRQAVDEAQAAYDALTAGDRELLDAEVLAGGRTYGRHLESAQWGLLINGPVDSSFDVIDGDYSGYVTSSSSMGKSTSQRVRRWTVVALAVADGEARATVRCDAASSYRKMRVGGEDFVATVNGSVPEFSIPITVNGTTTVSVDAGPLSDAIAVQIEAFVPLDAASEDEISAAKSAAREVLDSDLGAYPDGDAGAIAAAADALMAAASKPGVTSVELAVAKAALDAAVADAQEGQSPSGSGEAGAGDLDAASGASRTGESVAQSDSPSPGAPCLIAPKFKVVAKKVKARFGKKTVIRPGKAFKVTGRAGKVVYAKIKGNGKIAVSPKGKVTVKKGLKAGKTYKVKVLVVDFGSRKVAASAKIVALKVKVVK